MTWLTFLFGVLLAALMAAVMHLLLGRGCLSLLGYTLVVELVFWLGHWFAVRQGWNWGRWGALRLGPAMLGTISLLLVIGLVKMFQKITSPPAPAERARKPPIP